LEQIRNDYESDKLNSTQYKTLKEKIISGDVPKSNSLVVKDFITQINSAPNDETLDIIKEDIINTADTLTTATYQNLIGQIDQKKGNTPRAIEIDKERKILAKAVGLSGGDLEERAALRAAGIDAITTFEDLVAKSIDSDPQKIRQYLVDNYNSNILNDPDFPHLALTPNLMRDAYKLWDEQNNRIDNEAVAEFEKKIRNNPDISPNMKVEEERTLKHYIEYLKRTNADIEGN